MNPNKKTEKTKKAFYKKWWFWIIIFVVIIIMLAKLGNSSKGKSSDTTYSFKQGQEVSASSEKSQISTNTKSNEDIESLKKELKSKYDITEPSKFVKGKAPDTWKRNVIANATPPSAYAVKYTKAYMNKGDIYFIINLALKTTTMINNTLPGNFIEVKTTEYIKGEEHDSSKVAKGILYTQQCFDLDTGKEIKVESNLNAEKVSEKELITKVKDVTKDFVGPEEKITNIAFENGNLTVFMDISQADTSTITFQDYARSNISAITDKILELDDRYYNSWDTITMDFGEIGRATLTKDIVKDQGFGKFFDIPIDVLKK